MLQCKMITLRREEGSACIYIVCTKLHVLQAVHKELEKELGLKEVRVFVTSPEERWALR